MAGIIGVYAFDKIWNISKFLYYGLIGLQNRGYSYSGMSILKENFQLITNEGAPEDIELPPNIEGWAGIAYTGTKIGYPIITDFGTLVVDGIIKGDLNEIAKGLYKDPENTLKEINGVFSLIFLAKDGKMLGYRDSYGIKPLEIGGFGFDLAILSSETSGITVIGGEFRREIKPGEAVFIDTYEISYSQINESRHNYCAIDLVYQSRIDSFVFSKNIYEVRVKIGEQLAEEKKIDADVVIGVPDTAIPFAIGYSKKSGIPYDLGFTRTGSPIRTMLASDDFLKIIGVQLKLNPIKYVVKGKRVILIDDSMVTGRTLKNTVFALRSLGAKEVHVLIGSPKLISKCPYGMEVPEEKDLIAANLSEEEIAKVIGADSIYWLSLEGLYKVLGKSICVGCMTRNYPKVI
ncbi:amidophosphoribosyltransferase [Sulfurisphaera tokodaii]|uniref:Amidophosphoribosyltransferase n=2 Tax=Sulfurisphaera tokodaii TaxID=111955 RepID=F9VNF7_SULTO|nr:amidophosphoribosyltransferase [Sulfurisphaera tokodaii]BAK54603.1 putative amidophosphoribosyltransferase [Sulfurisphaera tokodaii str. 7]HII73615.1 amidophosphoribosyltransferase [Sulfurisphaera tokodaii]